MAPKKKAPQAPVGPTAQEVEDTYKEMDKVLEDELALMRATLISLQSETVHNEGLVERYGDEADGHQAEIDQLEKTSSAELLRLAKLLAQSEAQLRYYEGAVMQADSKVDAIYDDMERMKREDNATAGLMGPEMGEPNLLKAADGCALSMVSTAAATNGSPEFPPPLGTPVDTDPTMTQEQLASLFYTRSRQLQSLKARVASIRREEDSVVDGLRRLGVAVTSHNSQREPVKLSSMSGPTTSSSPYSHQSHLFLPRPDRKSKAIKTGDKPPTSGQGAHELSVGYSSESEEESPVHRFASDLYYKGEARPELSRHENNTDEAFQNTGSSRPWIRTALRRQARLQHQYDIFTHNSGSISTFPVVFMAGPSAAPYCRVGTLVDGAPNLPLSPHILDLTFQSAAEVLAQHYAAMVCCTAVVPQSLWDQTPRAPSGPATITSSTFGAAICEKDLFSPLPTHKEAFALQAQSSRFTDGSIHTTATPSNGTQLISELAALKESIEAFIYQCEEVQNENRDITKGQYNRGNPSTIVLLKGRVVPSGGSSSTNESRSDDLYISFADIDDNPTAIPPSHPSDAVVNEGGSPLLKNVELDDDVHLEGNQAHRCRPTTISLKTLVNALVNEPAALLAASPAFALSSNAPQVLLLLDVTGCTAGAGVSKAMNDVQPGVLDNDGFVIAVGPTSTTRFCYRRHIEGAAASNSASLLAMALTEALSDPKSTSTGVNAEELSNSIFSKLTNTNNQEFLYPPTTAAFIPSWALFVVPESPIVSPQGGILLSDPMPSLPLLPDRGTGILSKEETIQLFFFVAEETNSDGAKVPNSRTTTLKSTDDTIEAFKEDLTKTLGDEAVILTVGELSTLHRSFRHERELADAVSIMGDEVATHMRLGTYDSVAVGQRSMASAGAVDSPNEYSGNDVKASANNTLDNISVVYNTTSPISPYYANAAAAESIGAAKFAAAVRNKVLQSQGGQQEAVGSPTRKTFPNESIGLFNNSRIRYAADFSTTPKREPIFMLLTQRVPVDQTHHAEDTSLTYGAVLKELQLELTHRRLEAKTIPRDACYRIEVWGAHRRQVTASASSCSAGSGNEQKVEVNVSPTATQKDTESFVREIQVIVALWPMEEDPLEKWYLRVRHEARQAEDKKRLLLSGAAKKATIPSVYLSIRNTAVSVGDTTTATLSKPHATAPSPLHDNLNQSTDTPLNAAEIIRNLCREFFSHSIAIRTAPKDGTSSSDDAASVEKKGFGWHMTMLKAASAFVTIKDTSSPKFRALLLGGKWADHHASCYCIVAGALPANCGNQHHDPSQCTTLSSTSLRRLASATIQRRYGPLAFPGSSNSYNLFNARGPLIALFVIHSEGQSAGDDPTLALPQHLAFREALALLKATFTSMQLGLLGRDILPMLVSSSELCTQDNTDSASAVANLSRLTPEYVLNFLSTQRRSTPFPCMIIFQAQNRSIATSGEEVDVPPPPPKGWVIPARKRVGATEGQSQLIVSACDIATGIADYLALSVLALGKGDSSQGRLGFSI